MSIHSKHFSKRWLAGLRTVLLAALSFTAADGFAAEHTLSGAGGATLPGLAFGTAGNWSPAAVPGVADNAVIAATGLVDVRGSALGGAREIQDLSFTGTSAVTLQNNSSSTAMVLSLNGGRGPGVPLISTTGNVARAIAGPGTNATPQTLGLQLLASGTVDVAANVLTISARISESGGARQLTKTGAGTLVLSGRNSYSGGTVVNAGVLELNGAGGGNGRVDGTVTVNSGAELRVTGGDGTGLGFNDGNKVDSLVINGGLVSSPGVCHVWNAAVTMTGGELRGNNGVADVAGPRFEWASSSVTTNASASTAVISGRIHLRAEPTAFATFTVADGAAATDLLVSAALTESATGGGLVKRGAGTMQLTGPVQVSVLTVSEGVLDLASATLAPAVRLNVFSGGRIAVPTASVAAMYLDGIKLAAGRWGAPGSVIAGHADFESPALTGPGVVTLTDAGLSNRERWKSLKYGIFSHYTYVAAGTDNPNDAAAAFNPAAYANDVEAAGAQYVVWTAWHSNTIPMFPSKTCDKYGFAGRYSTRDCVSDMIDAVKTKGIRVFLYVHPYQPITSPTSRHNDFINDLFAEVVERYGSRIDGLWIDENQIQANQDSLVDYKRLMATVRERNSDLLTMHNGGQLYGAEMGGPEVVGSWNFGWSECMYNLANPGNGPAAEDMLRTTVLEAASNFEGGGIHWSVDGVANDGLLETTRLFALGRYLAPIRQSVVDTKPSTAFPPPYKDGRTISYSSVDWVATTSLDETKEFIHVLKAPAGNTLTLPAPADGKRFSTASVMASLVGNGGAQPFLGTAMPMVQTTRGLQLTLPAGVSWSALDTVIQLDVAAKGGAGMINNTSAAAVYSGASWTYAAARGLGEFNDDAHTATANGDAMTFTFNGTDVEFISGRGPTRGAVDVFVDNVLQGTVNLNQATTVNRSTVFSKSGLARGTHTLRLVKRGGSVLTVDAFKVTELINDGDADLAAGFSEVLSYGYGAASYSGLWQTGLGGSAWITPSVGYHPDGAPLTGSTPTGDSLTFNFYGTQAQVQVTSQFSSAYFYWKVDGAFAGNTGVTVGSTATFTTATLPLGNHTLQAIVWKTTTDPSQPGVNSFNVTRPGTWVHQTARGFGERGDDVHYTDVNPGAFSFSFIGSGADIITTRDSDARMAWFGVQGAGINIGARRNSFSLSRRTGLEIFSVPHLVPGSYTLRGSHGANTSGLNFSFARLAVDAVRIYKAESLSAAPLTWGATGGGGTGIWDTATTARWFDGAQTTPWMDFGGTDYSARFAGSAGAVTLSGTVNANRLLFETNGYTFSGSALTLNGTAPTVATPGGVSVVFNQDVNGTGGLTKTGPGTLTLNGANTNADRTTVAEGTLVANGTNTRGITVNDGATLAGSATVTGSITMDGRQSPGGTAPGILTHTGTITYGPASRVAWQLNSHVNSGGSGTAYDRVTAQAINVAPGAVIDVTLNAPGSVVNFTNAFWSTTRSWNVINHTGRTGTFTLGNVTADAGGRPANLYGRFSLTHSASSVSLTWTPGTPLENWRYEYFGSIANTGTAADTFDSNSDGEANLLEFATGQNPLAATRIAPVLVRNGEVLEFTYTRSLAALAEGITFTVEWSDTLTTGSWSDAGVTEQILSDNGATQTVRASVARSGGSRFLHLRISKP